MRSDRARTAVFNSEYWVHLLRARHTLGSLVRSGVHTEILTSKYIATDDTEKCTSCGACSERCSFMARWMNDGQLIYDQSGCFGCGLCISTCPAEAIRLVQRDKNRRAHKHS